MAAMGLLLPIGSAVIAGPEPKVTDGARSVIGQRMRRGYSPGWMRPLS